MSHKFNPAVAPYIPLKVEVAAKVVITKTLTHPLPTKPVSTQPSYARERFRAREIAQSCVTTQRSTRYVQYPPAAPSIAFLSKRYLDKSFNESRQKAAEKHFFSYAKNTQDISHTRKQLPDWSQILAMNGNMTDYRRETPREPKRISAIDKIHRAASNLGFALSPYIPETAAEYKWHRERKNSERDLRRLKAKKRQVEEAEYPPITNHGKSCMGRKKFVTNHSAVLAIKTMWCPRNWHDEQKKAKWPLPGEHMLDGSERHNSGYGRFLPVPRSENFDWRLATPEWLTDPIGTKYPVWDGQGPIPVLESSFAAVRGELDCIVGSGRWVMEEFLFGQAEETAWEDAAEIIGRALWEEMVHDERNELEKVEKVSPEEKGGMAEEKKATTKEELTTELLMGWGVSTPWC